MSLVREREGGGAEGKGQADSVLNAKPPWGSIAGAPIMTLS